MRPNSIRIFATLFLLPMALVACSDTKPTRLYVLSAMPEAPAATAAAQGPAIGVGPITLPKYLDQPQIVTNINANSLAQADLDQWGGDLEDNMTRVLAVNLSNLLETDRVSLYPWKDRAPVDYQVTLDVTRFERDVEGSVVLGVFWSVVNPADGAVLLMRQSSYRDAGAGAGPSNSSATDSSPHYDAVVAAMSRDLESLSRDIAAAITSLKGM